MFGRRIPVRRIEISKEGGKTRQLGIPTVVDCVIQQSIAQVLNLMYEPQFSETSYGGYVKRKEKLTHAIRRVGKLLSACRDAQLYEKNRRMVAQSHTHVCMEMLETGANTLQEPAKMWNRCQWATTRKGYWRTVHSPILTRAISMENLKRAHYPTLTEYYEKMHSR